MPATTLTQVIGAGRADLPHHVDQLLATSSITRRWPALCRRPPSPKSSAPAEAMLETGSTRAAISNAVRRYMDAGQLMQDVFGVKKA